MPDLRDADGPGGKMTDLGRALKLRRAFQQILDENNARDDQEKLTAEFSLDGTAYYKVTPEQKDLLMGMSPPEVREVNQGEGC